MEVSNEDVKRFKSGYSSKEVFNELTQSRLITQEDYNKALYIRTVSADLLGDLIRGNSDKNIHPYIKESVRLAEELWDELSKRGYTS